MAGITITNWFGDLISHPKVVVEATSVDDIVKILKDPAHYPSPVRAVGSNHSTAPVGVADGGTLIKMSKMNRILEIGTDTVTVQAGAIAIDVAHELQKHGLQFYVNTEIGSLSVGSAACAGTKDASMPGEYGQVGSYITRIKMVLPSGELLEVSEDQPDLMQKVRSCYGTFGIVYEATYKIRAIVSRWRCITRRSSRRNSWRSCRSLKTSGKSLMYYMFPFEDLVTVEFRRYNPGAKGDPTTRSGRCGIICGPPRGRSFARRWKRNISNKTLRYKVIDGFCRCGGSSWRTW